MPRLLLVLRHAKSSWDDDAGSDFDRPLAKRGKKDAPRIGAWLKREALVPDLVVSSPARRARQTARRVCEKTGYDTDSIVWEADIYGGGISELLGVLERCAPSAERVLLVGHNPGLEDLVTFLDAAVEPPPDGKLLPTAAVARLEMPDDWSALSRASARLLGVQRPKDLG
ncbi:MAG: histidine phosphatase family protein [Chromatiales bacterium]|jgi:phosphohistidine phosphatase